MTDEEAERNYIETSLRHEFESTIAARIDRSFRIPVGSIGPSHHFAAPTVECRKMFVAGEYFGCISLVQSVAEAIVRFLLSQNPQVTVSNPTDYGAGLSALHKNHIISPSSYSAFGSIRGPRKGKEDRNTFHHLKDDIELDPKRLEARAEQCLAALHEIESDVFGFSVDNGKILLKHPQYWHVDPATGMVRVMVRCN